MGKLTVGSVGVWCVVWLALFSGGCAGTRSSMELRLDEEQKLNVVAKLECVH